jgi:tripartite-type tricarboxylate transporter receptor subunit TctC
VKQPEVAQRFRQLGIVPVGSTPDAYGAMVKASYERYAKVVKSSGARVD